LAGRNPENAQLDREPSQRRVCDLRAVLEKCLELPFDNALQELMHPASHPSPRSLPSPHPSHYLDRFSLSRVHLFETRRQSATRVQGTRFKGQGIGFRKHLFETRRQSATRVQGTRFKGQGLGFRKHLFETRRQSAPRDSCHKGFKSHPVNLRCRNRK
jgi:hypothetical protein